MISIEEMLDEIVVEFPHEGIILLAEIKIHTKNKENNLYILGVMVLYDSLLVDICILVYKQVIFYLLVVSQELYI